MSEDPQEERARQLEFAERMEAGAAAFEKQWRATGNPLQIWLALWAHDTAYQSRKAAGLSLTGMNIPDWCMPYFSSAVSGMMSLIGRNDPFADLPSIPDFQDATMAERAKALLTFAKPPLSPDAAANLIPHVLGIRRKDSYNAFARYKATQEVIQIYNEYKDLLASGLRKNKAVEEIAFRRCVDERSVSRWLADAKIAVGETQEKAANDTGET